MEHWLYVGASRSASSDCSRAPRGVNEKWREIKGKELADQWDSASLHDVDQAANGGYLEYRENQEKA